MSENLRFNVAQLLQDPAGSWRSATIRADIEDLLGAVPDAPEDGTGSPHRGEAGQALRGPVRLLRTNQGILVTADIRGVFTQSCARCLSPVDVPVNFAVAELFVPTIDMATGRFVRPDEEDQALWIDEHHQLDLTEVLRQDLLLALPAHVVCSPGCKGLCPSCGDDRNLGSCDCVAESDPRWNVLRELLDHRDYS